jgi:sec-independent protein translocase protein TatC
MFGKHEKKEADSEKHMSFWDHLEELRWHLIRSILAVIVLAVVAFLNRSIIFDNIVLAPSTSDFFTNRMLCKLGEWLSISAICMDTLKLQIININMPGQFLTHMYISFVAGTIIAFPYILHQFWSFVRPGLREKEARYSGRIVIVSSLLFMPGYCSAILSLFRLRSTFLEPTR